MENWRSAPYRDYVTAEYGLPGAGGLPVGEHAPQPASRFASFSSLFSCDNDPLASLRLFPSRLCTTESRRGDMLRRRESRSAAAAAAAVAAWPLGPLALALALFSTMPHGALSRGLVLPPLPPPLLHQTCDNVPYPFGLRGKSVPGFEITCGPNNEAMLPIGVDSYRIEHVSVPEGFVIIFAGPIRQVCYDRHGSPTPTTGTGQMSLERTPFSFSKRNKLVATGCNYKLFANFTNQPTSDTSCSTWCTGSSNDINNMSCSHGRACCEVDMPMEMDGARDFTMTFERTPGNFTGEEEGTCSAAFFRTATTIHASTRPVEGAIAAYVMQGMTGIRTFVMDAYVRTSLSIKEIPKAQKMEQDFACNFI